MTLKCDGADPTIRHLFAQAEDHGRVTLSRGVWFPTGRSSCLLATIITSLTFVTYLEAAYAKDWFQLVRSLVAAVVLGSCRDRDPFGCTAALGMSACEYFGQLAW